MLASQANANSDSRIPKGQLTVDSIYHTANEKVKLKWHVEQPQELEDVVIINPTTDEVEATRNLTVQISMIGSDVTRGWSQISTDSEVKIGGGDWMPLFSGKGKDVNMSEVLIEQQISTGTTIEFRSRVTPWNSFWNVLPHYLQWKTNTSEHIKIYRNGDDVPYFGQNGDALRLEEYLKPFIVDNKIVIGDLDYIYCAELSHEDTSRPGYDMQDVIVLVRFIDEETGAGTASGEEDGHLNGGESENDHR